MVPFAPAKPWWSRHDAECPRCSNWILDGFGNRPIDSSRTFVDALVVSMNRCDEIDEYLGASGARATSRGDLDLLERYAAMNGARYCPHGCGACQASCPASVPISEVLRARMSAVDCRDVALARNDYTALERDASPCLVCTASPCAGACPSGIPTPDFTRGRAARVTSRTCGKGSRPRAERVRHSRRT